MISPTLDATQGLYLRSATFLLPRLTNMMQTDGWQGHHRTDDRSFDLYYNNDAGEVDKKHTTKIVHHTNHGPDVTLTFTSANITIKRQAGEGVLEKMSEITFWDPDYPDYMPNMHITSSVPDLQLVPYLSFAWNTTT